MEQNITCKKEKERFFSYLGYLYIKVPKATSDLKVA